MENNELKDKLKKMEEHLYNISKGSAENMTKEEHKEITGFETVAEYIAYELGREHEQKVTTDWIRKWDGGTNSAMGKLLFEKFTLYKDHPTTVSGSVAAQKEEKSEDFGKLKWKVGQILAEQFLKYNDGKFIAAIELNPATHALTEFIESENIALREALKELLPIAEKTFDSMARHEIIYAPVKMDKVEVAEIIDKARNLLSK